VLGTVPLVFALFLLLLLLTLWWRSLLHMPVLQGKANSSGSSSDTAEAAAAAAAPLTMVDNPLHPQPTPAAATGAAEVRLAARYLLEREDCLPPGWSHTESGPLLFIPPSGGAWQAEDPREDPQAYIEHVLAAWQGGLGVDVMALVPGDLVARVRAKVRREGALAGGRRQQREEDVAGELGLRDMYAAAPR
jgi:hypothetical protein